MICVQIICTYCIYVYYGIFIMHDKTVLHFFLVKSIFTKLSFTEFDEFFKEFLKVDMSNT